MKQKKSPHELCARSFMNVFPAAMQSIRLQMRKAARSSVTVPQFRVLARLSQGESTCTDLAEWIGVSQPAISRMADLLVQKRLVQRMPHTQDKRQVWLALTEEGWKLFNKNQADALLAFEKIFAQLSVEENESIHKAFQILEKLFNQSEVSIENQSLLPTSHSSKPRTHGMRPVPILAQQGKGTD